MSDCVIIRGESVELTFKSPAVEVRNGDMVTALKRLKNKVYDDKILIDYMRHMEYEKPSVRKRRKKKEAILRTRRDKERLVEERGY